MPRSKKLAAATRPSSLNLTNPKLKKPKLPQTPPPTPEEEDTMESFVEDIEEEWDDVDSLETHGSGLEDVDLEDGETLDSPPSENIPPAPKTTKASKQRRWDQTSVTGKAQKKLGKTLTPSFSTSTEPAATQELRAKIFPTLYAIFQQSRGQKTNLKIKNRTLRSLTKSCLYHKQESQLQRTLEDAEALLQKYCSSLSLPTYSSA
ncbi:33K [Ovine mastadenovirus A]|uniref:33K n=1 Tax=Ovine mastadenovirus A TaxID=114424 RepID=UPI00001D9688|nr:33K [Ovine mastadenovirus A]